MNVAGKKIYWFVAAVDRNNAGYRVRTLPLAKGLQERGLQVKVLSLDELACRLDSVIDDARAVICAKPSTPELQLCLEEVKIAGIPVIIDLFDNYFSWSPSLLARQIPIQWLKFLDLADHIIVSTAFLHGVIRRLTDTPATLIGDSCPAAPSTDESRNGKWPAGKDIQVLWYGINSNPFFKAGLDDLVSWKPVIRSLEKRLPPGKRLLLTICTNPTPNLTGVLERFRNAGIDTVYRKWSEKECASLLDSAHLILLPTNLTGFSLSKTHNRCSDALAKDCLILCSPSGPYIDIPGAVYTNVDDLCQALSLREKNGILERIRTSRRYLAEKYELSSIVERLAETIGRVRASPIDHEATRIVILGQALESTLKTISRLNDLFESREYLSAGIPESVNQSKPDICLSTANTASKAVDLTLTSRGHDAMIRILERNARREVDGDVIAYQADPLVFRFDGSGRRCRVSSADFSSTLTRIGVLRGIHDRHSALLSEWFRLHTGFLAAILLKAGFRDLGFATHAEAGWEEFAGCADHPLRDSLENLQQQFIRFESRECLMGCDQATLA